MALTEEVRKSLNPGIVKTVEWLNSHGFETCDSGDGETHDFACDLQIPYVHMKVEPSKLVSECQRLQALLLGIGIELEPCNAEGNSRYMQGSYDPLTNSADISLFCVKLA